MDHEKLEVAYEAESAMEAQAVQSLLEEQGIPYTTRSQGLSTLLGGSGDGGGALNEVTQILVHEGNIKRAMDAIMDYHEPG